MKLLSADNRSELTITMQEDEHGYKAYSLSARVGLCRSEFSGCNNDISFLNLKEFFKDLEEFILNRRCFRD